MKAMIKYILSIAVGVLLIACDKNDGPDLQTTLSDFGFITDNMAITLTGSSNDSLKLEWEKSSAENSTLVFYKVQFSDNKDDFSEPTHEMSPARLGANNFVSFSDSVMNIIAEKSSVRQLSSGNVYWRVLASNGINSKMISGEAKQINVTRPEGFAALPEKLYITGSATPGGDDLEKALTLKVLKKKVDVTVDSSAYDIVLPLKQGDFKLVSALKGRTRTFVLAADGKISEVFEENDAKMQCTAEGMYHIGLNFITNEANYAKVDKVDLVVVRQNTADDVITTLNYTDEYTWTADFTSVASGGGNLTAGAQYKFRFTETGVLDQQQKMAYWGGTTETSSPPTSTTEESYYYVIRANNDAKNYYRFATSVSGSNSGKAMRAVLVMNPTDENFYHTCAQVNN